LFCVHYESQEKLHIVPFSTFGSEGIKAFRSSNGKTKNKLRNRCLLSKQWGPPLFSQTALYRSMIFSGLRQPAAACLALALNSNSSSPRLLDMVHASLKLWCALASPDIFVQYQKHFCLSLGEYSQK
jgi:hypothetical protein